MIFIAYMEIFFFLKERNIFVLVLDEMSFDLMKCRNDKREQTIYLFMCVFFSSRYIIFFIKYLFTTIHKSRSKYAQFNSVKSVHHTQPLQTDKQNTETHATYHDEKRTRQKRQVEAVGAADATICGSTALCPCAGPPLPPPPVYQA